MSSALLLAGFLATANAGRLTLAVGGEPAGRRRRATAVAVVVAAVLVAVCAALADPLLDALGISPESFRIAAGLVVAALGLRSVVAPSPAGPAAAVLVTPDLAALAVAGAADLGVARTLGAAAIALAAAAVAAVALRGPAGRAAPFLGALGVAVGVALVVSGVRSV